MRIPSKIKQALAGWTAAALLAWTFHPGIGAAAESAVVPDAAYNYFYQSYEHLNDENHIFNTVTYHELDHLLDSEGTYILLIGGAWSEQTQASIGFINEAAKEYGVTAIYNFDPRLDGRNAITDISDNDSDNLDKKLYVELVNKYLTNLGNLEGETVSYNVDNGPEVREAVKIRSPFLFVYNKDHLGGPIISSLEELHVWEDFTTDGAVDPIKADAYKAKIKAILEPISETVDGKRIARHNIITDNDYYVDVYDNKLGRTVFRNPDQPGEPADVVFEHVTYDELTKILGSEGDHIVLFGGSWCPNTQPVIGLINEYAKKHHIDKIYNWDTKLDGGIYGNDYQVRSNDHPHADLYVDLVNNYLTNLKSEDTAKGAKISYTKDGITYSGDRLQVPYVFVYNKDNVDAEGNSAPIFGHIELMYTWSNILPDYVYKPGTAEEVVGAHYKNYTAALDTLFSRVEALPSGLAGIAPASSANNNGRITGTNSAQEYKRSGGADYTRVTGTEITGLTPGTYLVRYAAKFGYNGPVSPGGSGNKVAVPYAAGQAVEVVVPPGPDGDGGGSSPDGGNSEVPSVGQEGGQTGGSEAGGKEITKSVNGNTLTLSTTIAAETDDETGVRLAVLPAERVDDFIALAKQAESENKKIVIEIKIDNGLAAGSAQSVTPVTTQLTIPREAFNELAAVAFASVKIDVRFGTVVLAAPIIQKLNGTVNGDEINFLISKSELTEEGKDALGDRPVYSLSVFTGDREFTDLGGSSVQVVIPYRLQTEEDPGSIVVYSIDESGLLVTNRGQYNSGTGTVDFIADKLTQYIIGYNKVDFADVPSTAWHNEAIGFLAARGVIHGVDEYYFRPDANMTRGQFIVLLLNAYHIEPAANGVENFDDAGDTYYTDYLAAAKRLGITNGVGSNKFAPEDPITRQDLFTLLYRALYVLGELPDKASSSIVTNFSDADQIAGHAESAIQAFVKSGIVAGNNGKLYPRNLTTRAEAAQVLFRLLSK